jgi:hypothetical protein
MSRVQRLNPQQESLQREIVTPAILLVEGRTPEMFFRELIEKHLRLSSKIEAFTFGDKGSSNLRKFLNAFATKAEFRENVKRVGIVRDAEMEDATRGFQSVVSAIKGFNEANTKGSLPVPDQCGVMTEGGATPKTGVFILPDCARPGMLESLCLEAIEEAEAAGDKKLLPCVDEFFDCVQEQGNQPKNSAKARMAGYILAKDVIDPQLGLAARKGVIPWDAKAFAPLTEFVRAVAGED